jgi:hypothetical protein
MTGILRNLLFQSSSGTVGVHMNLSLYVYPPYPFILPQ